METEKWQIGDQFIDGREEGTGREEDTGGRGVRGERGEERVFTSDKKFDTRWESSRYYWY